MALRLMGRRPQLRFLWFVGAFLAFLLVAVGVSWYAVTLASSNQLKQVSYVAVKPGDSAATIAQRLRGAGAIRSALAFEVMSRLDGLATHLKAGVYRITPGMTTSAILKEMRAGNVAVVRVAVPEGYTVAQVRDALLKRRVGTANSWARALASAVVGLPAPAAGVKDPYEGYLFPATYSLPYGSTPSQALAIMVHTFNQRVKLPSALPQGLSEVEWVTLASIVQKEGKGLPVDREIAAVFLNRLHDGMPLDSDATVRYALGNAAGSLSAKDLGTSSPYNTYLHKGLPPGPICNPGLTALKAVASPAQVPYLYFVTTASGQYLFATTYQQHLQNVAKASQ